MTGRLAETLQLTQPRAEPARESASEPPGHDANGSNTGATPQLQDAELGSAEAAGTGAAGDPLEADGLEVGADADPEEATAADEGDDDSSDEQQKQSQYPAILALAVSPSGCVVTPSQSLCCHCQPPAAVPVT